MSQRFSRAIRTFSAPDKRTSIYVFGDEFTGKSIDEVVNTVDRLNRRHKKSLGPLPAAEVDRLAVTTVR